MTYGTTSSVSRSGDVVISKCRCELAAVLGAADLCQRLVPRLTRSPAFHADAAGFQMHVERDLPPDRRSDCCLLGHSLISSSSIRGTADRTRQRRHESDSSDVVEQLTHGRRISWR